MVERAVGENEQLSLMRQDLLSHARSITMLIEDQREIKDLINELRTDREVRKERDSNLNIRLSSIESIGRWILVAVGSSMVAAIATFIIQGGLVGK